MDVQEGYMPFNGYQTYYRILGDRQSNKTPLVLLHGGPGSTHNYFEGFDDLAVQTGRPIVMYDQLGCGRSSIPDDDQLWQAATWVAELQALRTYLDLPEIHLLGQSWGGMLAIIYGCDYRPQGIKSLILASTLSSARLWAQEQHRMIRLMSPADQSAIATAERLQDFTGAAYLTANQHFMTQHASGPITADDPEFLRRSKRVGTTAYNVAWGPNEYNPTGTLADYEYTDRLQYLQMPTLVTSGTDDLCTPLVAKTMVDQLPHATWTLFPRSRHMAFIDENTTYMTRLRHWLAAHD
ncbi:proline iminopeptidase [Lactiplantibacillus plantarum]|uniref:Proline iminopeptidase n=2 Tax=Lactiplantibacillus plantarum TaxID=1590 RepID=A0A1E3KQ06_LACPN|nr:Prolyl aminopeptidase [Lactiplantibacillus plantarum]QHM30729.1 Proline iminopeptidase [Lactiplantibacillus plantarum]QHM34627.1 Proline iminopeptidase [Lactiplantibacillus plantarum]QHM63732.1 Proline iminopeptidase [Lactiplantibacillus plantarum]QRQ96323.1 Proline iminopeptidase [Lactiplantibacillus plantarum]